MFLQNLITKQRPLVLKYSNPQRNMVLNPKDRDNLQRGEDFENYMPFRQCSAWRSRWIFLADSCYVRSALGFCPYYDLESGELRRGYYSGRIFRNSIRTDGRGIGNLVKDKE